MFCEILSRSNNLLRRVLTHKTFRKLCSVSGDFNDIVIPLPYGSLAAKGWGNPNGRPVLALHGWRDNCGTFDRLIPMLDKSFYIVALDLPGHGFSDPLPRGSLFRMTDFLMAIRRVLDFLQWKKFDVLGHSLGGVISQTMAVLYPDEVGKCTIIDAPIVFLQSPEDSVRNMTRIIDNDLEISEKFSRSPPVYDREAAKARLIQGLNDEITPESANILLRRGILPSHGGDGFVFTRDVRFNRPTNLSIFDSSTLEVLLPRLKSDILMIRVNNAHPKYTLRKHEEEKTKAFIELYLKFCKRLTYEIVDGNHFVHLNNPERISPMINRFLLTRN